MQNTKLSEDVVKRIGDMEFTFDGVTGLIDVFKRKLEVLKNTDFTEQDCENLINNYIEGIEGLSRWVGVLNKEKMQELSNEMEERVKAIN